MNKLCCVIPHPSLNALQGSVGEKRTADAMSSLGKAKKLTRRVSSDKQLGRNGGRWRRRRRIRRGSEWAFASCSRPSGQWRPTWLIAPLSTRILSEMLGGMNLLGKWVFSSCILWKWCAIIRLMKCLAVWLLIFHSLSSEKHWKQQMLLLAGKARVRLLVPDTGGR